MLADGMVYDEIIGDFPKITDEDFLACLAYAADRFRDCEENKIKLRY
ncbi:MAG: DUF433 domain-containing protein [Algicola sp.]|nr:DUF433 domain-containing protein [Algicola sp.]